MENCSSGPPQALKQGVQTLHEQAGLALLASLVYPGQCAWGLLQVMLGVDRLDMIKGIPQKLLAFEKFLEEHPQWRDKVLLVQIAVPSRTDVPEYQVPSPLLAACKQPSNAAALCARYRSRLANIRACI